MLLTALLLLQSTALPNMDEVRLRDCIKLAGSDPQSAVANSDEWRKIDGNYLADVCAGYANAALANYPLAETRFVAAAERAADARSALLYWQQAANAAIAAGNAEAAVGYLDTVINSGRLSTSQRAEALIDRARAHVSAFHVEQAESDLATVRRETPENGIGWLMSATLARRSERLSDAQAYIKQAALLMPRDAAVALEAGNIAAAAGAYAIAREQWEQTIKIAPRSSQAMTAMRFLAQLDEVGEERIAPPATPGSESSAP